MEVLIALALTGMLLSALLGVYWQVQVATLQGLKSEEKNFHLLHAQVRLGDVLNAVTSDMQKDAEKQTEHFFYLTENPQALIFTFDNGTGAGPEFSNVVIAKLFVDSDGKLMLYIWPSILRHPEESPPFRREELLSGVERVEYLFFSPATDEAPAEEGPTWPFERGGAPAIIRMKIFLKNEEKPLLFSFALPNISQRIIYP